MKLVLIDKKDNICKAVTYLSDYEGFKRAMETDYIILEYPETNVEGYLYRKYIKGIWTDEFFPPKEEKKDNPLDAIGKTIMELQLKNIQKDTLIQGIGKQLMVANVKIMEMKNDISKLKGAQ